MDTENTIIDTEATQDPEAQKILDNIVAGRDEFEEADEDIEDKIELPSGENEDDIEPDSEEQEQEQEEETLYADKYKTIDELKKGVKNLNSELSDTVLDGMSDEALESYYKELNTSFSKGRKHIVNEEERQEQEEKSKDKKPTQISNEVWEDLNTTFNEKGGLTEAQYNKLNDLGIPESIVDGYLDGLVLKEEAKTREYHSIAGGEEQFNTMKAWAYENLDNEYLESIGKMSVGQTKSVLQGIKAQYELANKPQQTKRVIGNNKSSSSGSAYKSQADYLKDVGDRRYSRDESYRKAVDRKLSRSKF